MDSSGRIHPITDEQTARARGLVPIPDDELDDVRAMSTAQRKRWYAAHLRLHPAAQLDTETAAEHRARMNARKRARKARNHAR